MQQRHDIHTLLKVIKKTIKDTQAFIPHKGYTVLGDDAYAHLAKIIMQHLFSYAQANGSFVCTAYYMEYIAQQRLQTILTNTPMQKQEYPSIFAHLQYEEMLILATHFKSTSLPKLHDDFFSLSVSAGFASAKSLQHIYNTTVKP
ncbi:MAG: hypothetical protein ACMXYC_00645 [Candidatus Woesearchaeota archaeon]